MADPIVRAAVIPREPSLPFFQFARESGCSQLRAFAGDVLYKEGMPATHLYLIREGEVDLYQAHDGKRVVVETLKRGQCFGIEPHLSRPLRLHNAAARSYCELSLVDASEVQLSMAEADELTQAMLKSLSERLVAAHRLIVTRVNYQPELQVYAQVLHLLGLAEVGRAAVVLRPGAEARSPQAQPLLQDVVHQARLMLGHSERHVLACLGRLQTAGVVHIDDEPGGGKRVRFAVRDIVAQVRRPVAADAKSLFAALARRDSLDLAKLLAPLQGEPVRQRILDALPRRRREEVEADLDGLHVDAVEAQQIGAALIAEVRDAMLQPRGG